MTTVLKVFDRWKQFLNEQVQKAEAAGIKDEAITRAAVHIGDYLSNHIDPENKEERVLKQLWDVADEHEKETLAKLMVKLVSSY